MSAQSFGQEFSEVKVRDSVVICFGDEWCQRDDVFRIIVLDGMQVAKLTDEEFGNAVFDSQEQLSGAQAQLLGAAFMLATGGPAQVHVGTGSGGTKSDMSWGEKKKTSPRR